MKALDPAIAEALRPRWLPDTLVYEMQRVQDGPHEVIVLLTMRPTIHGLRGARYVTVTQVGPEWTLCPWIGAALLAAFKELPLPSPDLLTPELRAEALSIPPTSMLQSFSQLDARASTILANMRKASASVEQMQQQTGAEL